MKKALKVLGEVWNCCPNTEYTLIVGKNGEPDSDIDLYKFLTDRYGNATLDGECNYISSDNDKTHEKYSNIHIILSSIELTEEGSYFDFDTLKEPKKTK